MADLTDFLLARIAEDEAAAREMADDWPYDGGWSPQHVSRVLAKCAADRLIVESHQHDERVEGCDCHDGRRSYMDCDVCAEARQYANVGGWCLTLRALVLPYADHPDYREEWKP